MYLSIGLNIIILNDIKIKLETLLEKEKFKNYKFY